MLFLIIMLFFFSTEFVERVWDPLSTREGSRLIALIKALQEDYPISGDVMQVITPTCHMTVFITPPTGTALGCGKAVQGNHQ